MWALAPSTVLSLGVDTPGQSLLVGSLPGPAALTLTPWAVRFLVPLTACPQPGRTSGGLEDPDKLCRKAETLGPPGPRVHCPCVLLIRGRSSYKGLDVAGPVLGPPGSPQQVLCLPAKVALETSQMMQAPLGFRGDTPGDMTLQAEPPLRANSSWGQLLEASPGGTGPGHPL